MAAGLCRWQKQVLTEKEACLRLKGENGLLRKKFDEQQKTIDDTKAMLRSADSDKRQLNQVQGAPAQYFPQESLPAGAQALALGAWWQQLQRTARHEDHPWNAGLLIESLVLQGRQCWPAREPKKSHVR